MPIQAGQPPQGKPPIVCCNYNDHPPGREGVAACLVWPRGKSGVRKTEKKAPPSRRRSEKSRDSIPKAAPTDGASHFPPDLALMNGVPFDDPPADSAAGEDDTMEAQEQDLRDEDTAIEALRGWPRWRKKQADADTDVDADALDKLNGDNDSTMPCCTCEQCSGNKPQTEPASEQATGKKDKSKTKKKKKDKKCDADDEKDPYMVDLIAHRFMREAAEARAAALAAEQAEAAKKAREANGKQRGVRSNRTSQLRQLHNAVSVEKDPLSLWKMPRFEKSAKPHLNTKRQTSKDEKQAHEPMDVSKGEQEGGDQQSPPAFLVTPLGSRSATRASMELTEGQHGNHNENKCMVHFDGLPQHPVTPGSENGILTPID